MKINESVDATKDLVEYEEEANEGFAVCVSVLFGVAVFCGWLLWDFVALVWG